MAHVKIKLTRDRLLFIANLIEMWERNEPAYKDKVWSISSELRDSIIDEPIECPFCRQLEGVYLLPNDDKCTDQWRVFCRLDRCEVQPETPWCKTPEEAVYRWNKRAK